MYYPEDKPMTGWNRPNPPRLNDTAAIVRKGTYSYQVLIRGTKSTSPLETPYNAENTFTSRSATKFASNSAPDRIANQTFIPLKGIRNGNGVKSAVGKSSLREACNHIPEGC